MRVSCGYFVQPVDGGPIKIGSSLDVPRRFTMLRGQSPYPLKLLAVLPFTRAPERPLSPPGEELELHDRFNEYRLHGEWFSLAPELLAFIDEVIAEHGPPPAVPELRRRGDSRTAKARRERAA